MSARPEIQFKADTVSAELQWASAYPLTAESAERSLVSLLMRGAEKPLRQSFVTLPELTGFATFLEYYPRDEYNFSARGEQPLPFALAASGTEMTWNDWRATFEPSASPSLVVSQDPRASEYRSLSRGQLEKACLDSLRSKLAFSFNCENDTVNRAFALLAATLIQAEPRPELRSRADLENAAQMARGMWLIMRARPEIVEADLRATYNDDERIRWGHDAFEAVLDYGMSGADSLRETMYFLLAGLSRLHDDYVRSSPEVMSDEWTPDSMTTLAVAQVRYAAMMNLGERLCIARMDYPGEITYRVDGARAVKAARRLFETAGERYVKLIEKPKVRNLEDFFTAEIEEREFDERPPSPPDTGAFLVAGARYGFRHLSPQPRALWKEAHAHDGFVRQKFTEFRLLDSLWLLETPDIDSLFQLLLAGPTPGTLSAYPERKGEVSWPVMCALVESLSELYLGVRPDVLRKKVLIEPRLPKNWGRTAARVPLGSGFLHVDLDYEHKQAAVWTSGIRDSLDVQFAYPFQYAGYARAEFVLCEDSPRADIRAEVDSEKRTRLKVKQ